MSIRFRLRSTEQGAEPKFTAGLSRRRMINFARQELSGDQRRLLQSNRAGTGGRLCRAITGFSSDRSLRLGISPDGIFWHRLSLDNK